jgi:acylphosphatase
VEAALPGATEKQKGSVNLKMSQKKALHVMIEGRVQGVGFRWFVREVGSSLGLVGYVKNLPDGRVEAVAEGDEPTLQQFLVRMHEGPSHAHVKKVNESWTEPSGRYQAFQISY